MTHELESYGLILLFVFVLLEGCGIPLPGETALITAAVLAGSGRFNIVEVIAVASARGDHRRHDRVLDREAGRSAR